MTIDATTDDSFATNGNKPAIILDGNNSFTGDGIVLTSSADGSEIRGFVIRDFSGDAIQIQAGSTNNTIAGNYIGRLTNTGADAGAAEKNTGNGISLLGDNNTIGGATATDRNVISGNQHGILILGATGNTIMGNYLGTDATGSLDLGNTGSGVRVDSGSSNNIVGGTTAGERNVISGNDTSGVLLNASGNVIQGNYIGVGADGTSAIGNLQHGVHVSGGFDNNLIGGATEGAGNIIANSQWRGINVQDSGSTGNTILGNSIYSSGLTGIDLGDNGVTNNDSGDGDSGANDLQNFPLLTSANSNATGTTLIGTLNSNSSTTYRIEFFSSRPTIADSPNGEGERYLGFTTVTTNASGNASFNFTLNDVWVNSGDQISATATVDLGGGNYGSTSEFAANRTATSTGIIVVDTTSNTVDGTTSSITDLGNNRGGDGRISLGEAILAVNNTANGGTPDKIVFNIAETDSHVISVASALPAITGAVTIDATSQPGSHASHRIVLDGSSAGVGVSGLYLNGAGSSGSTIQGFTIHSFDADGIKLNASNNSYIVDNYVGTDVTGMLDMGNSSNGVFVYQSDGVHVQDNVVSGNDGNGIYFYDTDNSFIQGNIVGLNKDGDAAIANGARGVSLESGASGNLVGGSTVACAKCDLRQQYVYQQRRKCRCLSVRQWYGQQ